MEIHGDGMKTRTFTYVSDTVDGFIRALQRPEARGEVVNVGGVETLTITALAERIQQLMEISGPLRARYISYESLAGQVSRRPRPCAEHDES